MEDVADGAAAHPRRAADVDVSIIVDLGERKRERAKSLRQRRILAQHDTNPYSKCRARSALTVIDSSPQARAADQSATAVETDQLHLSLLADQSPTGPILLTNIDEVQVTFDRILNLLICQ